MKRLRPYIVILTILTLLCTGLTALAEGEENLIVNGDFSEGSLGWETNVWDSSLGSSLRIEDGGASIESTEANDARFCQTVEVEADTVYRISCTVATEDIPEGEAGANITVLNSFASSEVITGTNDAAELCVYMRTAKDMTSLDICIALGGYGYTVTGKAVFSDVCMVKAASVPADEEVVAIELAEGSSQKSSISFDRLFKGFSWYLLLAIPYLIFLIVLVSRALSHRELLRTEEQSKLHIKLLFLVGLAIRLVMALFTGFDSDMALFTSWGNSASQVWFNVYNTAGSLDYPPLYIFILGVWTKLLGLFGINYGSALFTYCYKLLPIMADMFCAAIVVQNTSRNKSRTYGLLAAILLMFNPLHIMDCSIWAQTDSVMLLLLLLAWSSITKGKYYLASVMLGLAVTTKPQAILFLPVMLFVLLHERQWLKLLLCLLTGAGVIVLVCLPYGKADVFSFIIELYTGTAAEYSYASLNAFNLFALLGVNLANDTNTFLGLSYATWGYLGMWLNTVFAGAVYFRTAGRDGSNRAYAVALTAVILFCGYFVLGPRMHERYMFPVLAFLLIMLAEKSDVRTLGLFSLFSLTNTVNVWMVMQRYETVEEHYCHIEAGNPVMRLMALANVIGYGILVWLAVSKQMPLSTMFRRKVDLTESEPDTEADDAETDNTDIDESGDEEKVKDKENKASEAEFVQEKVLHGRDWLYMGILLAVALALSFIHLGTFDTPETQWQPTSIGDTAVITLEESVTLDSFSWYCGLGDGSFTLLAVTEDGNVELGTVAEDDFYKWKNLAVTKDYKTDTYLLRADTVGGSILEVGFWSGSEETPIAIKSTEVYTGCYDVESREVSTLTDEQDKARLNASWRDSTYFDEVYHARTAYEQLLHVEPYEYTHPPLGKILISIGIAIFGMNTFGWRFMGALAGAILVPLVYMFAKKLFKKRQWAIIAGVLSLLDFMRFSHSRFATIDIYTVIFILMSYYFMFDYYMSRGCGQTDRERRKSLLLCGIFFGLGASVKWNAIYGGFGLAVLFFAAQVDMWGKSIKLSRIAGRRLTEENRLFLKRYRKVYVERTGLWCVLCFIVIPICIYILSYIPWFLTEPVGKNTILDLWSYQCMMFNYHSKLTATHSFASPWYEWPLIIRPLWLYVGTTAEGVRETITSMGNPAVWWAGAAAIIACVIQGKLTKRRETNVLGVAVIIQLLPWMLVSRISFIYHYFPMTPFLVLAIVWEMKYLYEKYGSRSLKAANWWKAGFIAYIVIAVGLFVWFYPAISGTAVSTEWIDSLKWLPTWYF